MRSPNPMRKILVQDQATKRFLDDAGEWITDAERARNFPTSLNAIVHCVQKKLGQVQLLVRIEGPASRDMIVAMDEERAHIATDFATHSHEER